MALKKGRKANVLIGFTGQARPEFCRFIPCYRDIFITILHNQPQTLGVAAYF
jgi:hypothetical protein